MAELTPKVISELPTASAVGANDLFIISSGGVSKKVTGESVIGAGTTGSSRLPDGTFIQWGTVQLTEGTTSAYGSFYILNVTIVFPTAFYSSNYHASASARFGTGLATALGLTGKAAAGCTMYWWDGVQRTLSESTPLNIDWFAVGRWKA